MRSEREGEKRFAAKSPSHLLDADAAFTHPSLASSNDEQDQLCVRGIQLTSSTLVRPKSQPLSGIFSYQDLSSSPAIPSSSEAAYKVSPFFQ